MLRWIIFLAALAIFGFMAFDGTQAIALGDYIRPQTGEYVGQLGPWAKAVAFVGIDPESMLMKSIFVVWGLAGLVISLCYLMGVSWSRRALLLISVLSLWYLVPGTVLCVLIILLILADR